MRAPRARAVYEAVIAISTESTTSAASWVPQNVIDSCPCTAPCAALVVSVRRPGLLGESALRVQGISGRLRFQGLKVGKPKKHHRYGEVIVGRRNGSPCQSPILT